MQVVSTLVLVDFGRPPVGDTIKTNCIIFQTVDREIYLFLFFLKMGLGLPSSSHSEYDFSRKIFVMLYSID